jgi:hypothetical protein
MLLLSLVSTLGCEEISRLTGEGTQATSSANLKIPKSVQLGSEWVMKQIDFKVGAGDEVMILLKLSADDKVDGYFYLEQGDEVDFNITGKTSIYTSEAPGKVSSDRFSFVASEAQGDTYTLVFQNPADDDDRQSSVTVILEVIYPVSGSVYVPVEGE